MRSSVPCGSDVDDVVQDTFARIIRLRAREGIRSGKALLFAVARNAVRDLMRHRAVARHEPVPDDLESSAIPHSDSNVVDFVSRREELGLLGEAIATLPTRCREVLLLRKIQGCSQKEIAARFGISESTVETLVARGTRRCTEYLNARGLGRTILP